jgi:N-acetylmuramoyl-L-alanine amidase
MTYPIDTTPSSPNQSSRNGARISMLCLHATVGSYASSLAWLCNPASQVSTHYLIRKDGYINQLVPNDRAAWHAGKSAWMGMNSQQIQQRSLGIELENANDGHDVYPAAQLASAHWLCQALISRYNIERADVVRHLDIAIPKGRKTDPAPPFPWPAFADSLYMDVPPIAARAYHVVGVPIYQKQDMTGPLAGHLTSGDTVLIDAVYANGAGHDANGRGFVDLDGLREL